jgi:hypothetical protein
MSGRRRPRTFGEDPWVQWGCVVPAGGCLLFVFPVFLIAFINFFILGGDFRDGMIYSQVPKVL